MAEPLPIRRTLIFLAFAFGIAWAAALVIHLNGGLERMTSGDFSLDHPLWPLIAMGYNYGLDHPGALWVGMLLLILHRHELVWGVQTETVCTPHDPSETR